MRTSEKKARYAAAIGQSIAASSSNFFDFIKR
jgi:hypothetical protein